MNPVMKYRIVPFASLSRFPFPGETYSLLWDACRLTTWDLSGNRMLLSSLIRCKQLICAL